MAEQESSVVIVSNEEEVEQPAEKPQKPQKPQDGTPPVEDNAPEAEPDDDDQDGDDHKSRLQERFKKLTSQREEARADAAKAQQRAADLEARLAALEKPQQAEKAQEPQKPQPADYTDAFEYAEHLAEWAAKQALIARDAEERKKAEESAKAKVVDGWRERLAAVKTEIPDFDEAITASDVVVSDAVHYLGFRRFFRFLAFFRIASDKRLFGGPFGQVLGVLESVGVVRRLRFLRFLRFLCLLRLFERGQARLKVGRPLLRLRGVGAGFLALAG
jgi:hypothetical protein